MTSHHLNQRCPILRTDAVVIRSRWFKAHGISFKNAPDIWHDYRIYSLQWYHNERHGVPNHRHIDCLRNRLFRCTSKKTSKLRVSGLCEWNWTVIPPPPPPPPHGYFIDWQNPWHRPTVTCLSSGLSEPQTLTLRLRLKKIELYQVSIHAWSHLGY